MLINRHLKAALAGLKMLFIKPVITSITILIIAIALALPTIFWVLEHNLQAAFLSLQKQANCLVILQKPLTEQQVQQTLELVKTTQGVGKASLKTPEENLNLLMQAEDMHDLLRFLPSNPLPAIIEIVPNLKNISAETLLSKLKKLDNVAQVKFDLDWIIKLNLTLKLLVFMFKFMFLLLLGSVGYIITSALRLIFIPKINEIKVMKLIGARDSYILRPFIYSGLWYALSGSLVCVVLVYWFFYSLNSVLHEWFILYHIDLPKLHFTFLQASSVCVLCVCLGIASAQIFVRRQMLQVSLKDHGVMS